MRLTLKSFCWITYSIGATLIATGLTLQFENGLLLLTLGSLFLFFPWVICILNTYRMNGEDRMLWAVVLFFAAPISLPFYINAHIKKQTIINLLFN